ncbi:MAG TPA: hypothetical protein VGV14_05595 [Rhodanobacter sp.]|nr:hypothetical protein [Rhodanobacter sp.]
MNLGPIPSRTVSLPVGGVDAVAIRGPAGGGPLDAISGNHLIGLDVWAGVGASDRSFQATGASRGPALGDIEQMVSHILAPLG